MNGLSQSPQQMLSPGDSPEHQKLTMTNLSEVVKLLQRQTPKQSGQGGW